ncbi:MAG: TonB-dependent receptor [Prolixibacteraceae bacterium]|jgi:outer membrane cobalamin receptor|nr:TonB-dependent receptor [Prolixibacteraceae bacterium]
MKGKLAILIASLIVPAFVSFSQGSDTLKTEDILKMSFADLMNMKVISATRIEQPIKDVSATVHLITARQIKDRGYFTLEEALSDLPGLQFRNIVGFNNYVFMRGAPSQNNLILLLIDGIQINELNSGGFYGGGQFNLSEIDQIEVVYGPASALYGTNAVSGIINIITKKPEGKNEGHASVLTGNFKTRLADIGMKQYFASKDIGYSVSAMYKTSGKADLKGNNGDYNWTNNMENFEDDISLSAKMKAKRFNAGIVFQEKQSSMTTNFKTTGDRYLDKNTLWDITFLNAYLKHTYSKNEKWRLNSTTYYRNSTVKPNTIDHIIKADQTSSGQQVGYYRPNQLVGAECQFIYAPAGKIMLTGGIIGELENISENFSISYSNSQETKPPKPPRPSMLNNQLFSLYFQAYYKLSVSLSFTGGIRQDFSNYYGQVFTPRLGLVYNRAKYTAKALYNEAFRSPKPWDYTYGTGNNDLQPEKMHSLELSLSYQPTRNLFFGTSAYNNHIHDKLTKETNETVDRWTNKNKITTTGLEVYSTYTIRNLCIQANYTFNDSDDQDEIRIAEISQHTANAGITCSFHSNVKMNLRANYMGERKNPFIIPTTGDNVIDGALLFHACLSLVDIKGFDLQMKANNIFNTTYYHPSNRFEGRYRQPQQTFAIKLTYNW